MQSRPGLAAVLLVMLGSFVGRPALAADYYVNCQAGNDDADGQSPDAAWQTLAKVSATTFRPGDAILLKRGTRCTGSLWPKGSGEPGKPIRLGAYGAGALPIIDAAGGRAAVTLFNQEVLAHRDDRNRWRKARTASTFPGIEKSSVISVSSTS